MKPSTAKTDDWDNLAGHEMVIFGYDDNATAMDNEGNIHHGLLYLRNFWGADVGDHGDF